jgi:hypothetical protein
MKGSIFDHVRPGRSLFVGEKRQRITPLCNLSRAR